MLKSGGRSSNLARQHLGTGSRSWSTRTECLLSPHPRPPPPTPGAARETPSGLSRVGHRVSHVVGTQDTASRACVDMPSIPSQHPGGALPNRAGQRSPVGCTPRPHPLRPPPLPAPPSARHPSLWEKTSHSPMAGMAQSRIYTDDRQETHLALNSREDWM